MSIHQCLSVADTKAACWEIHLAQLDTTESMLGSFSVVMGDSEPRQQGKEWTMASRIRFSDEPLYPVTMTTSAHCSGCGDRFATFLRVGVTDAWLSQCCGAKRTGLLSV